MIKPIALSRLTERLPESLGPRLVNGDTEFTKVSTDTRTLEPGALFIALRGENFDGNTFVLAAQTYCHQNFHHEGRTLEPGALFIALRGENFDVNTFLQLTVHAMNCAALV